MSVVRDALADRGFTVLPEGAFEKEALLDPWALVERLVGERPLMLERQPIRATESGRSFASTRVFTPFHTDSQDFLGAPPLLQVMACRKHAESGGETILVDGWALLETIEREAPTLFRALFDEPLSTAFYFGNVVGPLVARKRGTLVLTVSPMRAENEIARAFAEFLARAPVHELKVGRGETLLVDNARMLHGRRAFQGDEREFLRLLAWLRTPFSAPARFAKHARSADAMDNAESAEAERRLRVVLEMTTGVPPAKLAAREGVAEAELYRWRSEAFAAARTALAKTPR